MKIFFYCLFTALLFVILAESVKAIDHPGRALLIDGINDYVKIDNTIATGDFTLEAWIYTNIEGHHKNIWGWESSNAYDGSPLFWSDVPNNGNDFVLSVSGQNLAFWDGDAGENIRSTANLVGGWNHVAIVRKAGRGMALYVNGTRDGMYLGSKGTELLTANSLILLGGNSTDSKYFKGMMDEVKIWNRAVTWIEPNQGEPFFNQHYSMFDDMVNPGDFDNGLVHYYSFDELTEEYLLLDQSGENHGEINGGKWMTSRARFGNWTRSETQSITVYFQGTGAEADWWNPSKTEWKNSDELVATLHHYHNESPNHHKIFKNGFPLPQEQWWKLWEAFFPDWNGWLNDVKNSLESLVAFMDPEHDHLILNVVGWSRGGVLAVLFPNYINDLYGDEGCLEKTNILVFDPVPGDSRIVNYTQDLLLDSKVQQFVAFYSRDERSKEFAPIIPAFNGIKKKNRLMLTIAGSHETMVGNLQTNGHSWAWSSYNESEWSSFLERVYGTTGKIALELLSSSNWGGNSFDNSFGVSLFGENYQSLTRDEKLTLFRNDVLDMAWDDQTKSFYESMRTTPFLARNDTLNTGGLTAYCQEDENSREMIRYFWKCPDGEDCYVDKSDHECLSLQNDVPYISHWQTFDEPLLTTATEVWRRVEELGGDYGADIDRDGHRDEHDNCSFLSNANQKDVDGDGLGDACEVVGDINNDQDADLKDVIAGLKIMTGQPIDPVSNYGNHVIGLRDAIQAMQVARNHPVSKNVFVTSLAYSGDFGGVEGADRICQFHASQANLPGVYKAWVAGEESEGPDNRFTQSDDLHYVLVDGTVIADNWSDFIDRNLSHSINRTELNRVSTKTIVWTGVSSDGRADITTADFNCDGWTSSAISQTGRSGNSTVTNSYWSAYILSHCDEPYPIYCVEQ